jgi:predicted permease
MVRAGRTRAAARWIYSALIARHPASRAGYGAQMRATFDALLAGAATRGPVAVAMVAAREISGLLRTRRPTSEDPRRPRMETLVQDLRYALKTFRKRPAFSVALVATLALGIGANTAIFSVVNAVLLQRLPFADPDRLVMIWEDASSLGFPRNTPAPANYQDWTGLDVFSGVAAFDYRTRNITGNGDPEQVTALGATPNTFEVLGVTPMLGRAWTRDEDVPGTRVAVISYALWQRRYGGDPSIVGRQESLDGQPYTILGVMPPRFDLLSSDVDLLMPAAFTADELTDRGSHYLSAIGRLAPGVSLERANAALSSLAARMAEAHPDTNRNIGMFAVPILDDYLGDTRTVIIVLLVAVGGVLLMACANVANLLLTSAVSRQREMLVRAALGAARARLIRQLLTESVLLATAGAAAGLVLAYWSFDTLAHLVPEPLADLSHVGLDPRVLGVTAALTIGSGMLFGLAPAWRASRVDFQASAASSRGVVRSTGRMARLLVVAEIALAAALLIGAGLFVRSFAGLNRLPLGFRPDGVLTAQVALPRTTYADPARREAFVKGVLERVRALPGVTEAGVTSAAPLLWKGGTSGFLPEGAAIDRSLPYDAANRVVTPGYMEAAGMTAVSGRFFDDRDSATGEPVAIVNQEMARQYWPGIDPVGRRFRAGSEGRNAPMRRIVAVVANTAVMGIGAPPKAEMYFPLAQSGANWMRPRDIVVRTGGDPSALADAVRRAVWAVDPLQPVSRIRTLRAIVDEELQVQRLQMRLMTGFAVLALVLAAVGIYGVMSHAVSARTREIGLRLALGGKPAAIRWRVVGQGMTIAAIGLVAGLLLAAWAGSLAQRLLFEVSPRDPLVFTVQASALALVCFLSTYLPALRASRVDPMVALRDE